jgi:5-methylcytosine-specific restriction endonuclease McrA
MLNGHVLVLNKSWLAVHVAPARRALSLMYAGAARAVHPHDYSVHGFDDWLELSKDGLGGHYVHTPSLRIRIPEVVILRDFNGFVRHRVRFCRQGVFDRDRNICQYCGKRLPRSHLTIDHVLPQSRGGGDTWDNLVLACLACNARKGNCTPEEARMELLHKPSKPAWLPHLGSRVPPEEFQVWRRFVDTSRWDVSS